MYYGFFTNGSNSFLSDLINKISPNKGSVTKESITTKCNGKDVICIQKDGKVTTQKQKTEEKSCEQDKNCHIVYAANERTAVAAIRAYTGVKNMNLTPLIKDSAPNNVTYYCNDSNRCWAVDHTSHKVIEMN